MKFKIKCSQKNSTRIKEKFNNAGLEISEDGEFLITENIASKDHIVASADGHMIIIEFSNVEFIEAFGKEVYVSFNHLKYKVNEKLYYFENMLSQKGFIRVNKSQIVNIRHIKEITPWFGQKYVLEMKSGSALEVNRSYYLAFKRYLGM